MYYKSLYGVNPLVNPKSQPHLKNGVKLVSALCVRTRKVATCDSSVLAYHNEVMACYANISYQDRNTTFLEES